MLGFEDVANEATKVEQDPFEGVVTFAAKRLGSSRSGHHLFDVVRYCSDLPRSRPGCDQEQVRDGQDLGDVDDDGIFSQFVVGSARRDNRPFGVIAAGGR